ncbi:MAG: hypothetical protein Q4F76_04605 [Lachnospiraceae bacterium]|nr:hypothetical protein [Lachnospiraceae bacterium]
MADEMMRREIEEAVQAGERALRSLQAAQEKLRSARNWGIWDMVGGGLLTNVIKHSRIHDASSYLKEAKQDLQLFQRELRDVTDFADLRIEIGEFLSFADFFFDGLVADYLVQTKISDAGEQVDNAIRRVEVLLADLRACQ